MPLLFLFLLSCFLSSIVPPFLCFCLACLSLLGTKQKQELLQCVKDSLTGWAYTHAEHTVFACEILQILAHFGTAVAIVCLFLPHPISPNPRGHRLGFNVMSEAASSHSSETFLSYRKSPSVRVNCGSEGEQQCLCFKTKLCRYQYHIMIILWRARSVCELGALTFKIGYHCIYRHRTDRHGLL